MGNCRSDSCKEGSQMKDYKVLKAAPKEWCIVDTVRQQMIVGPVETKRQQPNSKDLRGRDDRDETSAD